LNWASAVAKRLVVSVIGDPSDLAVIVVETCSGRGR